MISHTSPSSDFNLAFSSSFSRASIRSFRQISTFSRQFSASPEMFLGVKCSATSAGVILVFPSKLQMVGNNWCASISRAWNATIHDEKFIKAHHDLMTTNSSRTLVLIPYGPLSGEPSVSISFDGDVFGNAVRIQRPLEQNTRIVSYCNGLVCINIYDAVSKQEDFAVWNPSIQRLKRIPLTAIELPAGPTARYPKWMYGFGYDSTNDDHKFVKAVVSVDRNHELDSKVKIYSLKSNSWKKIQNMPCIGRFGLAAPYLSFLNGALHWLMHCNLIVTLDLATEKYDHFPTPVVVDLIVDPFRWTLEVLGGYLCVYSEDRGSYLNDVWIMKEYGVAASWTRLYTIDARDMPRRPFQYPHPYYKPLVFSKTGKMVLLVSDDNMLCWYDLEKKSAKEVEILGTPYKFTAAICVGNLHLLNNDPV